MKQPQQSYHLFQSYFVGGESHAFFIHLTCLACHSVQPNNTGSVKVHLTLIQRVDS